MNENRFRKTKIRMETPLSRDSLGIESKENTSSMYKTSKC